MPGAVWDRSRLDDVVKRAAAWLEARDSEPAPTLPAEVDAALREVRALA